MASLSSPERERLRYNSKRLFGNRDRLEVAAAIGGSADPVVNATDLSADLGMVNSRVRAQLIVLSRAGLLDEFPNIPDQSKRWYLRRDSPFWDACIDLLNHWVDDIRLGS
jgi:hypothetical protein